MHVERHQIPRDADLAELVLEHCGDILAHPNMRLETESIQHGTTTVLEHSATVAATALLVARQLHIPVDVHALARSALLHDYFLYDWHVADRSHRLHGFTHPYKSARNAARDHDATTFEQAMIRTHMFPLTLMPPTSREAWLLCLADKWVATSETARGFVQTRHDRKEHHDADDR